MGSDMPSIDSISVEILANSGPQKQNFRREEGDCVIPEKPPWPLSYLFWYSWDWSNPICVNGILLVILAVKPPAMNSLQRSGFSDCKWYILAMNSGIFWA